MPHRYPGAQAYGNVKLILVIDEAHPLTTFPDKSLPRSRLSIFEHVLTIIRSIPIFTVFLSTNTKLEPPPPAIRYSPSFRVATDERSNRFLFPPLTEFVPFDYNVSEADKVAFAQGVTLTAISSPEYMVSYGRPQ